MNMTTSRVLASGAILAFASVVAAQTTTAPTSPTPQKSLAATMGVYVFPTTGQPPEQQSQDEAQCYDWAYGQTGVDPFDLAKQAQQQAAQTEQQMQQAQEVGKGSGAGGAVGGAAVGALIGEIASDDAGKGAAIGATVGLIGGRRRGRMAQEEATQQVEQQGQQAQQATAAQVENFKKAFSVCLEAKEYMVKY
jgi:hypothetical protein